jgi:hypothetical protein
MKFCAVLVVILAARVVVDAHAERKSPDWSGIPRECRQFLDPKIEAADDQLAWQQRLSLATCEQPHTVPMVASSSLQLRALVDDLERAVQPSAAIYRDAMTRGPVAIRSRAAHELGDAYMNVVVLARTAVAPDSTLLVHNDLEPMLAGFVRDAGLAYAAADRLARH